MKVLLIDPWGTHNTAEYLNGLILGLSQNVSLTVFTNYCFEPYVETDAVIHKTFFRFSENMARKKFRKYVRGLEYLYSYIQILFYLAFKGDYDVVHINWLLFYKLDSIFLKQIKKHCPRVIYTAHNAIPHVNGEKNIEILRVIYNRVDRIIVHGQEVKDELLQIFPDVEEKVFIQKHGCIVKTDPVAELSNLPPEVMEKCSRYEKVFLNCGAIFPNKGTDRLAKIWLENFQDTKALLIIAGRQTCAYPEFESIKSQILTADNVILLDYYIEERIMDALFAVSSAILIPYRHASMSGTVFSAAWFAKTVLCTDVGALSEYLESCCDSLVCSNSETGIINALSQMINMSKNELLQMGKRLQKNINRKCDWSVIAEGIVKYVYQ